MKCLEGSNKDALIYPLLIRAGLFFHWWLMAVPAMDSQQLLERESRNQVIFFLAKQEAHFVESEPAAYWDWM